MVAVAVVAAAEIEMEGIETGTIRTAVVVVVTPVELVQEKTETMTPIKPKLETTTTTTTTLENTCRERRTSTILTTSSVISLVQNTSNARCTKTSTRLRYES